MCGYQRKRNRLYDLEFVKCLTMLGVLLDLKCLGGILCDEQNIGIIKNADIFCLV